MSQKAASVVESIFGRALESPQALAVIDKARPVTFGELARDITETAAGLGRQGASPGDNVVIHAANTYGFVCTYFAVHLLGCRSVPVDPQGEASFLEYVLQRVQPALVVADPVVPEVPAPGGLYPTPSYPAPDSVADIMFTSGTTGEPKGAAYTHLAQVAATQHIIDHVGNGPSDRELLLMPLSHSFGLGRMRSALYAGTGLVLGYPLIRVKGVLRAIEQHEVTGFGIVPTAWRYLQELAGARLADLAGQIRYIELGSARLSPQEKAQLRHTFPTTRIVMHYGLTEVSRAVFVDLNADPDDAVGVTTGSTSVRLLDEAGKDVLAGEEGEIALRAPWMITEYFANPELTDAAFVDGYLRTGDLGAVSGEHLYLRGRLKEIINVGGKKVAPETIERVLLDHPMVADAACIPVADSVAGEAVCAVIVASEEAAFDEASLRDHVRNRLPVYMQPTQYRQAAEIPRTATGKIQRVRLAETNSRDPD